MHVSRRIFFKGAVLTCHTTKSSMDKSCLCLQKGMQRSRQTVTGESCKTWISLVNVRQSMSLNASSTAPWNLRTAAWSSIYLRRTGWSASIPETPATRMLPNWRSMRCHSHTRSATLLRRSKWAYWMHPALRSDSSTGPSFKWIV